MKISRAYHLTDTFNHRMVWAHSRMNPKPEGKRYWSPNTDVFISKTGDLIVKVALSGLESGDIQITVENKRLKIKGAHRDAEVSNASQLLVNEIPAGQFESVLEVPEQFDVSASISACSNGVLRILVPFKPSASRTCQLSE